MNDLELSLGYLLWLVIILLTIVLFNYFSKKYNKLLVLIPAVMIRVWIIAAILQGIINIFLHNLPEQFTLRGILSLMAETFAHILVIGGITFSMKYLRFVKKRNKVNAVHEKDYMKN
jgi:hypothetical protein